MNADASQPSKPATLLDLVAEYRQLLATVDECDGEVDAAIDAALTELAPSIERKLEACAILLRELEGDASAAAAVAEHYTRRKERKLRQREQLRDRMAEALRAMGVRKVTSATGSVWLQKSGTPKLVIKDEAAARAAGWTKVVEELDRERLRKALEECGGTEHECGSLNYAELVTTESLRIK